MTPPRQTPAHRHVPARARAVVIALALGIVAALAAAERADAGDYVVTQCSSVTPFVQASWERSSEHYRQRALCGTDGGLQVFHDAETTQLGGYGAWVWRAPSGTVFTDVQANASLTNQAGHHGELAVVRTDGGLLPFGSEHNDFRVHSIHGEFTQFHAWLRCAAPGAGQPCGRAGEDAAHAYVRGVYLRTDDRVGPRLAIAGGSLLEPGVIRARGGWPSRPATSAAASARSFVEGNGSLLVTDVRNCLVAAGFATALRPCPAGTFESAAVPTSSSAFVTGPRTRSRPASRTWRSTAPRTAPASSDSVWVDNACPSSTVGGGTAVSAGFADGSAASARSRPTARRSSAGGSRGPGPARPSARSPEY